MLSALRLTPPVAESSAMALARYTDHTAQGGSLIGAPSVSLFGEYLLDFQNTAQSLTSALYGELEVIFSRIDVHDISPSHNVPKTTSRSSSSKSRDPSYIEPAYNWLLTNLHNPYPSKATLTKIARKAKSDVKSVEAWFIDARGRIGWTTLRKTHFRNKQADIVDAATCFFVQLDEKRPLYATLELEFTQVEVAAKNLYADKFQETALVATLDVAVKDLTPEMKQQAQEEALKRRQAASSYPSPLHSPERSPEPESVEFSPLEQDVDLATTLPDAISRLKRRSSSPENDANTSTDRPAKRARLQTPPPAATGLPSPTPLSHEPLRRKSPSHPPPINSTPLPTISRKRRLSDADGQGAAKRPCNLSARPRLQTVSDPLPMATSSSFEIADMDNWFNTNFGSFSPATVDPFDDTLGLDLDFYTYSDVDTPSTATGSLAAQSPLPHCPDVITSVVCDDTLSNGLEISTNSFDYNELFDDYELPLLPQQALGYQIPDALSGPQPPLSEFAFLTNLPAIPYPQSYDSISAAYPPVLDDSIDWNFPPFEPLISAFNSALPDFDRNVQASSSLPIPATIVPRKLNGEGKAEIQLQLAAMKEEMRRLEERIAQSS